jgi:cell division protein FtsB
VQRLYAIHRPVENAYLVRERDRRLIRELMGVVAVVLVLGGGLLAYTWVHIEIVRTGYRIDQREKELHGLREDERRRRLEVARLRRPELIEERARRDLDMREPTLVQTVFYQELVR